MTERTNKKIGLSQEALKVIACVTMLIDHIGATGLVGGWTVRMIGRVAFPIFCFLLAEGAYRTKNEKKYFLRLFIAALLSELPFDYAIAGRISFQYQSVMLTMMCGFGALVLMKRCDHPALKLLVIVPFAMIADFLRTDYGGAGVILIAMFGLTRDCRYRPLVQTVLMALICNCLIGGATIRIFGTRIYVELLAVFAMPFIALYSGKKLSYSRTLQWGFYLFYPVHLSVLCILRELLH